MRIASLVPQNTVESIYRSVIPMQALAHRGHSVHIEERNEIRDPAALLDFDAVQIMRISHPLMVRIARRLQQRGVAIVWDNDDQRVALLEEAAKAPGQDGLAAQRFFASMRSMASCADAVTTPSEALARLHANDSRREVQILPNRLPPTFKRPERVMPHQGIHIGWLAMPNHRPNFDALGIRETLEHLLARHAHLNITGIGLDLELNSRRYSFAAGVPYGSIPESLMHLDMAIAPLPDTAVNQARTDVKLKEFAAAGVPWLASPVGPYAALGEQQGGRLVADGDWFAEIDALMNDVDARRVLSQRGMRWAGGETIEGIVDVWEQTFQDAIAQARAPHAVG